MHERREGRCALCDLADAAVQLALQREGLIERAVRDLHPVRRAVGEGVSGQRGRGGGCAAYLSPTLKTLYWTSVAWFSTTHSSFAPSIVHGADTMSLRTITCAPPPDAAGSDAARRAAARARILERANVDTQRRAARAGSKATQQSRSMGRERDCSCVDCCDIADMPMPMTHAKVRDRKVYCTYS